MSERWWVFSHPVLIYASSPRIFGSGVTGLYKGDEGIFV